MKPRDSTLTKENMMKMVFLLLIAAVVSFLLSNTKVFDFKVNQWYKATTSSHFKRPDLDFKTSLQTPGSTRHPTTSTTKSKPDVHRCSYKYLSPENAEDGRRLLDSITWPEIPPLPKPFSLNQTTSAVTSSFSIVPRSGGWRVGDELTVMVQLRDYNGNPKETGGDFLISRLHNRMLGAGVVGQVQDNLNGTFTVIFPLLWNGTADVEVTLVHPSEAIPVLKRVTEEQPDRIYFGSDFRSGSVETMTICNVCLDPDKQPVCNFTDINTGEQWFCIKPPTLDCSTRVTHVKTGVGAKISKEETTLFKRYINVKTPIKALGNKTILILPKTGEPKKLSPGPSGYYFRNLWRPLGGPGVRSFDTASAITACLKGKQLHMFGDSTVRQYYTFITQKVPDLMTFDKHSSSQCGPLLAVDHTNDIMMTYRGHGPPFRSYKINVSQLRYVANELDGVNGGANTVVVIAVWAHFSSFPMEVYYQRLMTIRRAVQRLIHRAPGTKVIVRTGNMVEISRDRLTNSEWYILRRDKVLRAVFKDSGVILLEAWEMVQAHYLPHNIHPPPPIIKLMVDQILSVSCPEQGK